MPWLYRANGGRIAGGESARKLIATGSKVVIAAASLGQDADARHAEIWLIGAAIWCRLLKKSALPERQRIARIKMLSGDSRRVHPEFIEDAVRARAHSRPDSIDVIRSRHSPDDQR
ncbi:hypothetical protein [Bradyrhizobium sp. B120]|uniref:hypothetical protein n=1 Tax=Bradyrhizobium sp. B120 TaxID=3410088 RepID=UPI003B985A06